MYPVVPVKSACNVGTVTSHKSPVSTVMMGNSLSGVKKMTAKAAKTVKYGASVEGISTAEPDQYAKRFLAFMGDAIE